MWRHATSGACLGHAKYIITNQNFTKSTLRNSLEPVFYESARARSVCLYLSVLIPIQEDVSAMSLVSLTKIHGVSTDSIKCAISESLDLIGYPWRKEMKSVVIKANLCYYWDRSTGQTTDPMFVAALIDLIREKLPDPDIVIAESDASAMKCKYVFKMLGYEKLSQDRNVRLINLSEDKSDIKSATCGGRTFSFLVPRAIQNADLRINIPKIKYTRREIKLTCALKNIFGCNPYQKKFQYHPQLGEVIVALNKVMKFDLCIIDGNIVSGIQPRRMGLVVASQDPVAVDAAAAEIAGINPRSIKYLQLAEREGLGNVAFVARGEPISYFKSRYPRKTIKKKLMENALIFTTRMRLNEKLGLK